jgi:hypothetical protein
MNDAEETAWLICNQCGSRFMAEWFRVGTRCANIPQAGDQTLACGGILIEYQEWKRLQTE